MSTVTLFTLDHPRGLEGATLVAEGALQVVYAHGGRRAAVASHLVTRVIREGDPLEHELLRLDALLAHGELAAAEAAAARFLAAERPAWAAARAAGVGAAARLLRARLEGRGAAEAVPLWQRALELAGATRPAARACAGLGDAALLAGQLELARQSYGRLAKGDLSVLPPWRFLGELGLLRVQIAEGRAAEALPGLEALERVPDPFAGEAAMLARVVRAETLARLRRDREAAELLECLREDPGWAGSPVLPRAMNALAAIYLAMGGKRPDGTWRPEGVLAGLPVRLRIVRYGFTDVVERATALAGAVAGLRLSGQEEIAEMLGAELAKRFPNAKAVRELLPAGRAPGD